VTAATGQPEPKFGEPHATFPMDQFHEINAATNPYRMASNENVLTAARLPMHFGTGGIVPHLLRRILSDDTAIDVLQSKVAEAEAERDEARAELAKLRPEFGVRVTDLGGRTYETAISDNADDARTQIAAFDARNSGADREPLQRCVSGWEAWNPDA
jgi:hypothetical protein